MRDDLRHHGHTKTGDGGKIEGIDTDADGEPYVSGTDDDGNSVLDSAASGGSSVVAEGTFTVNGTTIDRKALNLPRDGHYQLTAYPESLESDSDFYLNETGDKNYACLQWSQSAGDWQLEVDNRWDGTETTIHYKVVEL